MCMCLQHRREGFPQHVLETRGRLEHLPPDGRRHDHHHQHGAAEGQEAVWVEDGGEQQPAADDAEIREEPGEVQHDHDGVEPADRVRHLVARRLHVVEQQPAGGEEHEADRLPCDEPQEQQRVPLFRAAQREGAEGVRYHIGPEQRREAVDAAGGAHEHGPRVLHREGVVDEEELRHEGDAHVQHHREALDEVPGERRAAERDERMAAHYHPLTACAPLLPVTTPLPASWAPRTLTLTARPNPSPPTPNPQSTSPYHFHERVSSLASRSHLSPRTWRTLHRSRKRTPLGSTCLAHSSPRRSGIGASLALNHSKT